MATSTQAIVRSAQALVRNGEAIVTSAEAVVRNDEAVVRNGEAVVRNGEAVVRNDEAVVTSTSSVVSNGKAIVKFIRSFLIRISVNLRSPFSCCKSLDQQWHTPSAIAPINQAIAHALCDHKYRSNDFSLSAKSLLLQKRLLRLLNLQGAL
ncbi:MAG: hypothetical protein WCA35_17360 [Kovacikia sp.]